MAGVWLITAQCVIAQTSNLQFEVFSTENGLSQVTASAILQDQHGYIWVGTDDGLNRFDGYEFKVFRYSSSQHGALSDSTVYSLFEDRDGYLWIGTANGLNRYDNHREQFESYSTNRSGTSSPIYTIFEDSKSRLWVGTEQGLRLFDRQNKTLIELNHSKDDNLTISHNRVHVIYEDSSNNLWVGTNNGLNLLNREKMTFTRLLNNQTEGTKLASAIQSIYQDKQGILYIGTRYGLKTLNPETQTFTTYLVPVISRHDETAHNFIIKIFEDSMNTLWIATYGGGLKRFDRNKKEFTSIKIGQAENKSIEDAHIISLFEDRSNSLWVGTLNSGIAKHNVASRKFKHLKSTPVNSKNLNSSWVGPILADTQSNLWLGLTDGFVYFDRKKEQIRKINGANDELKNDNIKYLHMSSNGTLWLATYDNGLLFLQSDNETFGKVEPEISGPNIIVEDADKKLWIGTTSGLYSYDPETKEVKHHQYDTDYSKTKMNDSKSENGSDHIYSLSFDDQGYLWFGTLNGELNRVNLQSGVKKQYKHDPTVPLGFSGGFVFNIYQDSKNRVWIGTSNGLNFYDAKNDNFIKYTSLDGLANNTIYGILEDNQGYLWLSTNKGLSKFNPDNKTFINLDPSHGLQGEEFNMYSYHKGKNGEIFFGGTNGLTSFFPNDFERNPVPPEVVLTDFMLFNQPVSFSSDALNSPLHQAVNQTKRITLTHEQSMFTFKFSALHFSNSSKNSYRYQLQGYDKNWIETTASNRNATYTNLDSGNYTFFVKGSNSDGIWNNNAKQINITIMPPWWKTWWAYAFYLAVLSFSIILIIHYRTRAAKLRAKYLENKVANRTQEIRLLLEQKDQLFANVSHEFRTPLTLISSPINESVKMGNTTFNLNILKMIQFNVKRLTRMVEQLLDLSKYDEQNLNHENRVIKQEIYDLLPVATLLVESFKHVSEEKKINLETYFNSDRIYIDIEKELIEKVLLNLLSNAIKYTPPEGRITCTIELDKQESNILISIKDNGMGIAEDKQMLIFKRFTRVSGEHTETIPGAGIGLSLVKTLVESNGGKISVNSQLGKGSTFQVAFPTPDMQFFDTNDEPVENKTNTQSGNSANKPSHNLDLELAALTPSILPSRVVPSDFSASQDQRSTILVVEDNLDMQYYIISILDKDYECLTAQDGVIGLEIAKNNLPDLIVSDVMMPKMDGFELTHQLKTNELTNHIPVILLTAKNDSKSRIKGLSERADLYLAKPFDATELHLQIENLLFMQAILRKRFNQNIFPKIKETANESPDTLTDERQSKFIQAVDVALLKNYANPDFNTNRLASNLAMTNRQLQRKFKALIGLTPTEYTKSFRLNKAAESLLQGEISSNAGLNSGFTNPSSFSKVFKMQFGCSPSQYRAAKQD